MELGYWKIRGRAQHIRLLLEYTGERYKETGYLCGPPPGYDKSGWLSVKETLNLDFPNLPYLLDGDVRLTQSNTTMRYIGRRHGLLGETEEEQRRLDLLESQLMDVRNGWSRFCYSPDFDTLTESYKATARREMERLSKFLGDRQWFTGDRLTVVDFTAYELLDCHRVFDAALVESYSNLSRFVKRFERLDGVREYMASDRFMRAPLNNTTASFGNQ